MGKKIFNMAAVQSRHVTPPPHNYRVDVETEGGGQQSVQITVTHVSYDEVLATVGQGGHVSMPVVGRFDCHSQGQRRSVPDIHFFPMTDHTHLLLKKLYVTRLRLHNRR